MDNFPKNVIVTGASSGVGKAVAQLLAKKGATVFLISRRQENLDHLAAEINQNGGTALSYAADLSDYTQVQAAFGDADNRMGAPDALINCAGLPGNNIFNTPAEEWQQVISVNLMATMYCSKEAAVRMRQAGQGRIVNIGSLCIRILDNGADIYVASKTAVAGFTASLRKEVANDNIAVTLVSPGAIASDMIDENEQEKRVAVEEKRMLKPEDVAEAVVYALSLPERMVITELEVVPRKQLIL